jgi:hypothetical protein
MNLSMHCLQHTVTLLLLHTVTFSIFNIASEAPLVWRFFSHPRALINERASVGGYAAPDGAEAQFQPARDLRVPGALQ